MNRPLKTVNKLINELGECGTESFDVKLLGVEALVKKVAARKQISIPQEHSFYKIFGTDHKFWYRIDECHGDDIESCAHEIGIGHIETRGTEQFLVRDEPHYSQNKDSTEAYFNNVHVDSFNECPEGYFLVVSYVQLPGLDTILVDPGCIPYSDTDLSISPLYVDNNSFITNTPEKGLTSVSAQALDGIHGFSDSVIKSIKQHTKDLILQSKNVSVKSLTFKASKDCKTEKIGTVFFDKESKTLKCYDGTTWRTLSYEDT